MGRYVSVDVVIQATVSDSQEDEELVDIDGMFGDNAVVTMLGFYGQLQATRYGASTDAHRNIDWIMQIAPYGSVLTNCNVTVTGEAVSVDPDNSMVILERGHAYGYYGTDSVPTTFVLNSRKKRTLYESASLVLSTLADGSNSWKLDGRIRFRFYVH